MNSVEAAKVFSLEEIYEQIAELAGTGVSMIVGLNFWADGLTCLPSDNGLASEWYRMDSIAGDQIMGVYDVEITLDELREDQDFFLNMNQR